MAVENWASLAPLEAEASPEGLYADRKREERLRRTGLFLVLTTKVY